MAKIGKKISSRNGLSGGAFGKSIGNLVEGLVYISETDAAIEPVFGGKISKLTVKNVLDGLCPARSDRRIEEVDFDAFFEKLVRPRDWDRPEEIKRRHRFAALRDALKQNLTDIHIYRVGNVQIDIYIVGIDNDGRLAGVKTKAVET